MEAAKLRNLINGLIRKPQQPLGIVDAHRNNMLKDGFPVSLFEFPCQIILADVEFLRQLIQGDIRTEPFIEICKNDLQLGTQSIVL